MCYVIVTFIINFYFRDVGDGLCEMEGRVTVDSDLLKYQAPLWYKYRIYSSQKSTSGDEENPYEFLHSAPGHAWGQVVDRKFIIHKDNFVTKG